ncbi:MAG TPA: class I SAM-dependent methyltransferase [Candidatus Elarobacter sp.]|nr:class I SAM-dependent methyltransferase [Candidatus Elarobacter sp.]
MSGPNPLYDDPALAAAYARVTAANVYNAAYERPAVREVLGDVRGHDVLDAAAAAGEHSAWLVGHGARVVALDASEAMVELARARLGDAATVLRADLTRPLPLADASFDIVLSSLTLHYLEDWIPTLREFARVLRPGGRLVLSTHHPFVTLEMTDDYHALRCIDDAFGSFSAEPVPVRYYHRSVERIVDDLRAGGFAVRALREPRPTAEADARDPSLAARLRTRPWFLIVDAETVRR